MDPAPKPADAILPLEPGTSTIKAEFNIARRVLMSIMPRGFERDDCAFDLRYRPMIGIGGDYASLEPLGKHRCFFTVSDVTGHGIAAALMVRDVSGYVKGLISGDPKPAKLVDRLNDYLVKIFADAGIFMTFTCGLVDLSAGHLDFCGAGHPPLILVGPTRPAPILLQSQNPLLGFERVKMKSVQERVELRPGDRLLFYTDGFLETRDASGAEFGLDRFVAGAPALDGESLGAHLDRIVDAVDAYRSGGRQRDDLLVASLEIRGPRRA